MIYLTVIASIYNISTNYSPCRKQNPVVGVCDVISTRPWHKFMYIPVHDILF